MELSPAFAGAAAKVSATIARQQKQAPVHLMPPLRWCDSRRAPADCHARRQGLAPSGRGNPEGRAGCSGSLCRCALAMTPYQFAEARLVSALARSSAITFDAFPGCLTAFAASTFAAGSPTLTTPTIPIG